MIQSPLNTTGRRAVSIAAIALLTVCATPAAQSPWSAGITAEGLRAHVEALGVPDMLGRDTPGPGGDLAARYVAQAFMAAGLEPLPPQEELEEPTSTAEAPSKVEPGARLEMYLHPFSVNDQEVNNVMGVLWGEDPADGAVVVGAHYDGVGSRGGNLMPLSDDNASGTAILIAVAESLVQSSEEAGPLPHTVVFVAFGSEEDGLLGAKHYCEHPPIPLERTRAMINLDTIGRPRSQRLEIVGWSRYRELSALLEQAAAEEGLEAMAGQRALWWRSDQAVFADAGVPAVWLLGHLRDDIHSRADTPDGLDYEWMVRVARALVAAVRSGIMDRAGG